MLGVSVNDFCINVVQGSAGYVAIQETSPILWTESIIKVNSLHLILTNS